MQRCLADASQRRHDGEIDSTGAIPMMSPNSSILEAAALLGGSATDPLIYLAAASLAAIAALAAGSIR
jgi:hypothetical protein